MSETEKSMTRQWANWGLILFFMAALWLPTLDNLLGWDKTPDRQENRKKAPIPDLALNLKSLESYPARYEAFYNDHFGFRNLLIKWFALAKHFVLQTSGSDMVVLGRDDWLFAKHDNAVEIYRCLTPFTEEQLIRWQRLFESRRDRLAAHDIEFFLVIVPGKHTIYPEYLPPALNRVREVSRLDQLAEHLHSRSTISFLDLRGDLRKGKEYGQTYLRTDTHYNDLGKYIAYRQILQQVAVKFPAAKAAPPAHFRQIEQVLKGGDLARLMGIQDYMTETTLSFKPRYRRGNPSDPDPALLAVAWEPGNAPRVWIKNDPSKPRAVFVGDSFGLRLMEYLNGSFSRLTFFWHIFSMEGILHEKPDLVVLEIAERYLSLDLPENPEEMDNFYELALKPRKKTNP